MRIFCTIKYETIVTNKEDNIEIAIIPDNTGRFDITNLEFEKFEDHFIGFDNILLKEYLMILKITEITMSIFFICYNSFIFYSAKYSHTPKIYIFEFLFK